MFGFLDIGAKRWRTYAILTCVTLVSLLLGHLYAPMSSIIYKIVFATAYESFALMVFILGIGTYQYWRTKRRLPVNIMLRRDIGIWAGITAIVHALFGLTVHMRGDVIAYFFERHSDNSLSFLWNDFGQANYTGAIAAFLLLFLLAISNDWTMKKLRGKRWKWLMRLNYIVFGLVAIHTALYQGISNREKIFGFVSLLMLIFTLFVQTLGVFAQLQKRRQSNVKAHAAVVALPRPPENETAP